MITCQHPNINTKNTFPFGKTCPDCGCRVYDSNPKEKENEKTRNNTIAAYADKGNTL